MKDLCGDSPVGDQGTLRFGCIGSCSAKRNFDGSLHWGCEQEFRDSHHVGDGEHAGSRRLGDYVDV